MRRRAAAALLAALVALPAAAYLLPAPAVLKRLALRREELALSAFEVQGTLTFAGEAARQASAAGLPGAGGEASAPALLTVKLPGRCRLEALTGEAAADRPAVRLKGTRLAGQRGLEQSPPAAALVLASCALLAHRGGGAEPERAWVQALGGLGVALEEVSLGRQGGRPALVLGGRPRDERPQAWFDKQGFQPVRLVASLAGERQEVRLLDWGSSTGGEIFPRAVEVWSGRQLRLRFTTEKVAANPRVADGLF